MSQPDKPAPQQNGHADPEELQENEHQHNTQRMGIEQAMQRAEEIRSDLLDEISDSDLNPDSKGLLENLISKDFIFANLTEEEVTEFKFKLLLRRQAFYTMHPSQESIIEGKFREYIYDDSGNSLRTLTQQERLIVDQFFEGVFMRVTRARQMRQQEILRTQIQQSLTGHLNGEDGDGGLMGRWRE